MEPEPIGAVLLVAVIGGAYLICTDQEEPSDWVLVPVLAVLLVVLLILASFGIV